MYRMFGRQVRFLASAFNWRHWAHLLRMVHFYGYSHVGPLRQAKVGPGAAISPTATFRCGQNIHLGANVHIGDRSSLWAGVDSRIFLGDDALLGPDVYVTTSNYRFDEGAPVREMDRRELDVHIGADCWLGAKVIVLPGVSIGAGTVVGAGSVVTRTLPPGVVAVGNPARIVRERK